MAAAAGGINTTCCAFVIAVRTHHNKEGPNWPTENERMGTSVAVTESARLFAGGDGAYDYSIQVARSTMADLNAMTTEDWWAHGFILHPDCFAFVHHLL